MPSYRKRPVIIQAVQLPIASTPAWLVNAMAAGTVRLFGDGTAEIDTLEGMHTASAGDWIIKGVKGELYPCKPDIFAITYEPAIFAITYEPA